MRIFRHYRRSGAYPEYCRINHDNDWDQFLKDPKTEQVDLHLGALIDFSKIDTKKINIHMWSESPGGWFNGRTRGKHMSHFLEKEVKFDYILTQCRQEAFGRGYIWAPYSYDFNHVSSKLDYDSVDYSKKDIDVFMCATLPLGYCPTKDFSHPVWWWWQVMKNFNHVFANGLSKKLRLSWKKKMETSIRSKISIVFTDFTGATPECINFAKKHVPWVKFRKGIISENGSPEENILSRVSHMVTPQMKYRIFDAAFSKSIILCWKGPFSESDPPYSSYIEDYLEPDVDFIYFTDDNDLNNKILEILDDYNNSKYRKMTESAYVKMKENFDINVFYEKHIVSLAEKGKPSKTHRERWEDESLKEISDE